MMCPCWARSGAMPSPLVPRPTAAAPDSAPPSLARRFAYPLTVHVVGADIAVVDAEVPDSHVAAGLQKAADLLAGRAVVVLHRQHAQPVFVERKATKEGHLRALGVQAPVVDGPGATDAAQ